MPTPARGRRRTVPDARSAPACRSRSVATASRARGAAASSSGVDVVIADDGLQNPALARDVEICVIDGAAPLRQRPPAAGRAAARAAGAAGDDRVPRLQRRRRAGRRNPDAPRSATCAVAGRAAAQRAAADVVRRPARARGRRRSAIRSASSTSLRAHGIEVDRRMRSPITTRSSRPISPSATTLPVLMTEKDAIKCAAFARAELLVRAGPRRTAGDILRRRRDRLTGSPRAAGWSERLQRKTADARSHLRARGRCWRFSIPSEVPSVDSCSSSPRRSSAASTERMAG